MRAVQLIAEIGQNHNGDMGLARELIHQAKENGATVAKFQVFDARQIFSRDGNPWFDYNCRTELTRDQVGELADECAATGIEFMASAFDASRIAWLEEVGVRRHKIASRSIRDTGLLAAVTSTGKPLIVSLGHWNESGFPLIHSTAPVEFLFCVAKYPARPEDLNLEQVDFGRYAGFSDHTIGLTAACAALARGARIIEKHFTLDKGMYGPDHPGSMTPADLRQLSHFGREVGRCL